MLLPHRTRLCKASIKSDCLPSFQKTAMVMPRRKNSVLDPAKINKYRPISTCHSYLKLLSSYYLCENFDVCCADRLKAGESLTVDQSINSQNNKYFLVMQGDGNLVLYQRVIVPVWSTGTSNTGAKVAVMQADENFVVYDGNGIARWNSGTGGFHDPGCALVVQNDGNLVIYESTGRVVWTR